jgi:ABC-type cobalamin/Fe3+-siderophores transport system ATPase subunit
MTNGNTNTAKVTAIMGATGCGKTTTLRALLAKPKRKRTIVWSPKEPIDNYAALYAGSVVVNSASEVLRLVKAAGKGEFHIVFRPRLNREVDQAQFGAVCKIAMAARNVTMVVDELHTVTRPSWAPDGWSELIMMGRGYGCEVFGLSQRPASIDKDFLSNASMVHTGRLAFADDAKAVAKSLTVPWADVMNLSGFQWVRRDILTGKVTRG